MSDEEDKQQKRSELWTASALCHPNMTSKYYGKSWYCVLMQLATFSCVLNSISNTKASQLTANTVHELYKARHSMIVNAENIF